MQRSGTGNLSARIGGAFAVLLLGILLLAAPARAQDPVDLSATLSGLIAAEAEKAAAISALEAQLAEMPEGGAPALAEELAALQQERAGLAVRIEEIATGQPYGSFNVDEAPPFNLQSELQQLIEPFVSMMKSATEDARQIERLRQTRLRAESQAANAEEALAGIAQLRASTTDESAIARLEQLRSLWQSRRQTALDLAATSTRQLEARLSDQASASEQTNQAFSNFFGVRGRNLAIGVGAFTQIGRAS